MSRRQAVAGMEAPFCEGYELRYRFLIDQLKETVIIYEVERDDSGRIVDWIILDCNPSAEEKLGLPLEEVRGKRSTELFGHDAMAHYFEISNRLDGTREIHKFETHFDHDDRDYSSSVFFLTKDLYVNVSEDITARKREERERLRLQRQLLLAQKLEELGKLAGGIAHDFNNLLQPILLTAQDLLESEPLTPTLREGLTYIEEASKDASRLSEEILTYARQAPVKPDTSQPTRVVKRALDFARSRLNGKILLKEELFKVPSVQMSETGLRRVFDNLLKNALQAIGEKDGSIQVRLNTVRAPLCLQGTRTIKTWVCLSIIDDGPGIAADHLKKIFNPSFSTKKSDEGTGFGLAVVRASVEAVGGSVNVESKLGEGARFDIFLPLADTLEKQSL